MLRISTCVLLAACTTSSHAIESTADSVCVIDEDVPTAFQHYNDQTGGVAGSGLPLSGVFWATSTDGHGYWTQCFERRVLEYHASNSCAWRVEGRQLGADRFAALYHGTPPADAHDEGSLYFDHKHPVRDDFYQHWLATGNGDAMTALSVTGYPISGYFVEASEREPGKTFLVQYFERAIFELHPEVNDPDWKVMGKLLGNFSPMCAPGNKAGTSLDIMMGAFIPGPKPGTSAPSCERVNFGNFWGGVSGGIFNTDGRDFDYASVMSRSKIAEEVSLTADGVSWGSLKKYATRTCRWNDDNGDVFGPEDDWCRKGRTAQPVGCADASSADLTIDDARPLGTQPDGRIGQHLAIHLLGRDPMIVVAPPIEGTCEIDAYFDGATREPVDFWAHCSHKAFPSFELYVGGVQVKTHSAFSHSPGDLIAVSPFIKTNHHCTKSGENWNCVLE